MYRGNPINNFGIEHKITRELQEQNQEKMEMLRKKTSQIREMSLTIKDHLENEQKTDLKNIDSGMSNTNPLFGYLIRFNYDFNFKNHKWCWMSEIFVSFDISIGLSSLRSTDKK